MEGFRDSTLMMPSERPKGVSANSQRFKSSLVEYTGRSISKKKGRVWAAAYIASDNPHWLPPVPRRPKMPVKVEQDKATIQQLEDYENDLAIYEAEVAVYNTELEAYGEARTNWDATRLELWSTILGQCSNKLKAQLRQSTFLFIG